MFYLFRARGGVSGIPLPGSAQYRLWIQPQSRRLTGRQDIPKPRASGPHQSKVP
jgi:hypothetical protein